jgi:aspartyl/asparaginyl beta-hydroxylase
MLEVETLLRQAQEKIKAKDWPQVAVILEQAFAASDDKAQKAAIAGQLGGFYFRQKEYAAATKWFERLTSLHPGEASFWFDLGRAKQFSGDDDGARKAYLKALRQNNIHAGHYLAAGAALHRAGREEEALQVWTMGDDRDPMLRQVQFNLQADQTTREESHLADQTFRKIFSELHRKTIAAQSEPDKLQRVMNAIWSQTHDGPVEFPVPQLQPQFFYMPDLPPIAVFDVEDAPWVADLETATDDIRSEYLNAIQQGIKGAPYVQETSFLRGDWDKLRGKDIWNSIHLYKDGQLQEGIKETFPKTLKVLDQAPITQMGGNPIEAFISVLKPGAHIPPHYGLTNIRMTTHLPLIVPEDCAIRVGDEILHWQEGKILAFDDSFNHEAWNKSDKTRVVLIFEAWAPDLSEAEQKAISASFEARNQWLKNRKIPKD